MGSGHLGEIDLRVISLPLGSWLLWATTLLLIGGFGREPSLGRRVLSGFLGGTLLLHLAADFWPILTWAAFGALALTCGMVAWQKLSSLTVAATVATAAVMILSWPAAVASGLDPVATAGVGVGFLAAATSPGLAAPAAALLGGLLGHLTLGHSFGGAATFAPDTEQLFQVAGTGVVAAAAFSILIDRAWALRGRFAR